MECIENLNIKPDGKYMDGTLGGAGHSSEIVKRLDQDGHHYGIDQDGDAIAVASEKPVRKISKFDIKKAEEEIEDIEMNIEETKNHLAHLTDYAIAYFRHILDKYGKGRERKTEIRNFEDIESSLVAMANEKLYVNYQTGFAGYGLKKEDGVEVACECSKMDDIIVFRKDGTLLVTKIQEKGFVGSNDCKELQYVSVFHKGDKRTVYNLIYRDGAFGIYFVKRFSVTSIIRDREYPLTMGTKGSKIVYFTANPNGEAEVITIHHASNPKLKRISFDFDFSTLAIKGREAKGNIITKNAVRGINKKEEGVSTLGARKIWFDESIKRLNVNEAGLYLGEFKGKDKILTLMQSGYFKTYNFDLSNHFEDDLVVIRKYSPKTIVTAIYREAENNSYYVKRFVVEDFDKKLSFLDEGSGDQLVTFALDTFPRLEVVYDDNSGKKILSEIFEITDFIAVKGYKAKGKRLTTFDVKELNWLDPLPEPEEEPEEEAAPEGGADDEPSDRMGYAEGTQASLFDIED